MSLFLALMLSMILMALAGISLMLGAAMVFSGQPGALAMGLLLVFVGFPFFITLICKLGM